MNRRGLLTIVIGSALLWAGIVKAGTLIVGGVTVEYEQVPEEEAIERCSVLVGKPVVACAWIKRGAPEKCWVILPTPVSPGLLIHEVVYRCVEGRWE